MAIYNPQDHIVQNKGTGVIAKPVDARSWWTDGITQRPFASAAEVLAYFNTPASREGNFLLYIGAEAYTFKGGTTDAHLVPFAGGTVDEAPVAGSTNAIASGYIYDLEQTLNQTEGGLTYTNGSLFAGGLEVKLNADYFAGIWAAGTYQKGWVVVSPDRRKVWKAKQTHNSATAPVSGANWELLLEVPGVDTAPVEDSANAISSGYLFQLRQQVPVVVNGQLQDSAGNPITINGQLDTKPVSGSTKAVQSKYFFEQEKLYPRYDPVSKIFTDWQNNAILKTDAQPVLNSVYPIASGYVYALLQQVAYYVDGQLQDAAGNVIAAGAGGVQYVNGDFVTPDGTVIHIPAEMLRTPLELQPGNPILFDITKGYNARVAFGGNQTIRLSQLEAGDDFRITFTQAEGQTITFTAAGEALKDQTGAALSPVLLPGTVAEPIHVDILGYKDADNSIKLSLVGAGSGTASGSSQTTTELLPYSGATVTLAHANPVIQSVDIYTAESAQEYQQLVPVKLNAPYTPTATGLTLTDTYDTTALGPLLVRVVYFYGGSPNVGADVQAMLDDHETRITSLEEATPTGGATVTASATNGNLLIEGQEVVVYDDSMLQEAAGAKIFADVAQTALLGTSKAKPFILGLELSGRAAGRVYGISNVWRNNNGWLVSIGSRLPGETSFTTAQDGRFFVTPTSPYVGDKVTVHPITALSGAVTGKVAVNWDAIPDGFRNKTGGSSLPLNTLSERVWYTNNNSYIGLDSVPALPAIANGAFAFDHLNIYPLKRGFVGRNAADDLLLYKFIKGIQLVGTKNAALTYYISAIWCNYSNGWLVNINSYNPTGAVKTLVCNYNSGGANPKVTPAKIQLYSLTAQNSSGITGFIALDWNALPDGTNWNPLGETVYPLDDAVWLRNHNPLIQTDLGGNVTPLDAILEKSYSPRIAIPSVIHVATGRELNLWWDTIALYEQRFNNLKFQVVCSKGMTLNRGFRFTPTATGDFPITVIAKNTSGSILQTVNSTIRVVSKTAGTGTKNILMVGDSRTWQNISDVQGSDTYTGGSGNKAITTEVKALLTANTGVSPVFIGSQASGADATVRNEGYSGAGISYFLGTTSPFYDAVGARIDFKRYMTARGYDGQSIDIVTIMLGVNDIWSTVRNNAAQDLVPVAEALIPGYIANTKTFITKMLDATYGFPAAKIVLVIEPTTSSPTGFGDWYGTVDTIGNVEQQACEKALHSLREALLLNFDNFAYNPNVYISAGGLLCDRTYGFPYVMAAPSARASTAKELYHKNSIHPHDDGYKQIADAIFSSIKAIV